MRTHPAPSVCVVGNGYVGTVVAACLASLGRTVVGLESDPAKLLALREGRLPFHEPELQDLLSEGLRRGALTFTDDPRAAAGGADVVFLCVGSPPSVDGGADLRPLEAATRAVGAWARPRQVFVIKTTVPVGTAEMVGSLLAQAGCPTGGPAVISNPEFLRQGSAVQDFMHPDRVVLGGDDEEALDAVVGVYRPILEQRFPGGDDARQPVLVRTTSVVAEAAKYAANAFLATKVSFINEVANICDRVGADVTEVARVMGLDQRIGPEFLRAGLGWGGSCFAKDLEALIVAAQEAGYVPELLEAVRGVNERQRDALMAKLIDHVDLTGARVALLGLAFKPGTDDLRDAPSLHLAERLLAAGAEIRAFDPVVEALPGMPEVVVSGDPYEAAEGADAVVVVTDWPEFRGLDLAELRSRTRGDLLVDGRNAMDPQVAARAGFVYQGMGRGGPAESSGAARSTADMSVAGWAT